MEDVTLDPFSDDVSFRLGGRALDALLEIFTYNDFAVRRFLEGYKFCLLEHLRRSPLPSLLCTQERFTFLDFILSAQFRANLLKL